MAGFWKALLGTKARTGRSTGRPAKVEIDGVTHEAVRRLVVKGDKVTVDGRVVSEGEGRIVAVRVLEGVLGSLEVTGDVVARDVTGDVAAGGDVTCETVGDSVEADGDVTCKAVSGRVVAGGDVVGSRGGR